MLADLPEREADASAVALAISGLGRRVKLVRMDVRDRVSVDAALEAVATCVPLGCWACPWVVGLLGGGGHGGVALPRERQAPR